MERSCWETTEAGSLDCLMYPLTFPAKRVHVPEPKFSNIVLPNVNFDTADGVNIHGVMTEATGTTAR
jgi:hypothetical protein